jgi:hypothetical protein
MNERIKQLWEEAAKTTQGDSWEEQTKFMEKFAELIVQECIAQVEQAKNSPFVSLDDAKRMAHLVDVTKKKIGKHFGLGL